MPPIVLALVQGVLLLLLYMFVWRAVRTVVRDLTPARPAAVPAAPAAPRSAAPPRAAPGELVVHLPDGRAMVVRLDAHDITFGRSDTATVVLSDPYVSDTHARIYMDAGQWHVTDLGSTNGTYLNQVRLTSPAPLSAGDQLSIGRTTVEVRHGEGARAVPVGRSR